MQKITTFLWFDNQAEQAVNLYVSLFKNSKIVSVARYGEAGPGPAGSVMTIDFQLDGQDYIALNGGPLFKFTEAISLMVRCESQAEVDRLWSRLTADGGEESQCGWLKDKFGLSWQVIPAELSTYIAGKDAVKSQKAVQAMLQMKKIDINQIRKAYEQG